MDCKVINLNEKDQFIPKLEANDPLISQLYKYDMNDEQSFKQRMNATNNGREQELANIIHSYMSDLSITTQQQQNIKNLASGSKVVIGGQQAGLFGGPLYTFHKIFSIITLANELTEKYHQQVVPVFWIAGEDHDFDEVNHTFVYNEQDASLHKVKYHTMEAPETTVSRFVPDKDELKRALVDMFKQFKETEHSKSLYELCLSIIDSYHSWSDMFKALLHEVFKGYGLLLIDAQYEQLRQIEGPMFEQIIQQHDQLDETFRTTQQYIENKGLDLMIQTDTNVHLFIHDDGMRQLLNKENAKYILTKSGKIFDKEDLLNIARTSPHLLSNNVVTRPLMEEWLFNTVAFVGGPSEIKYWAELKEVFELFNVDMPIVMPRLRMSYLMKRTEKLLTQYDVSIEDVLVNGIEDDRNKFIREQASETFLQQIESLKQQQQQLYKDLFDKVSNNQQNINLLNKNNDIHQYQFDYLIKRYLLNIERENDISMKHFREIQETLHPMGGLQERVWNPLQLMNNFGIDVFSPSTYPPLSYTLKHIIIKP
ncbi:bacillithiol biosynthesis cysteine-adding enzyme BshC [Staphylococcus simiae]|uniref:Putative cysteine ligase BshC n=1 Tax=Staphylococcus simiae CCM 7213 = CCUG 51256 TaxID=911238 RepID=G5JLK0_9STAP|nr:bacillithiol biosynthesis cysteine-adding enzyme BshC [Staphylococcus simiae]EHJ06932.1 hypothetical protein SS7213T_11835 [Staphylococcus simiae CCM 7213 = CCUG 51256]PNZ11956.1 bacillithiol biosynthesis cysteine-adding enzyme BshC [Staphylococcus simiae]SNV68701.1 bacillithiol biosynthesis cysteine-adding enzyme BshC [Staphylococcus simiae]